MPVSVAGRPDAPRVPPQAGLTCSYLTAKEVKAFLEDVGRKGTGILQKVRECPVPLVTVSPVVTAPPVCAQFVGCRGKHHHTYMVRWSKGTPRLLRATNRSTPAPGVRWCAVCVLFVCVHVTCLFLYLCACEYPGPVSTSVGYV